MRRKRPISVNSPPQPKKKSPVPDTLAPAPWRGAPWRFQCTSVLNERRKSFLAGLGAHQAPCQLRPPRPNTRAKCRPHRPQTTHPLQTSTPPINTPAGHAGSSQRNDVQQSIT